MTAYWSGPSGGSVEPDVFDAYERGIWLRSRVPRVPWAAPWPVAIVWKSESFGLLPRAHSSFYSSPFEPQALGATAPRIGRELRRSGST